MTTPLSPSRMFNGLEEDIYNEAKFAHEINDKMRVPKRIKATGEYTDEDLLLSNQNGMINSWNYHDKIDMNVPDRIVVLGHDQHLETRSAPREIQLENSILPKQTNMVRVQTPPRIITLNEHPFPSASEDSTPQRAPGDDSYDEDDSEVEEERSGLVRTSRYVRAKVNGQARVGFDQQQRQQQQQTIEANSADSDSQVTTGGGNNKRSQQTLHDNSIMSLREGTPNGELSPREEILYLRRQLAKVNRRVLDIEIGNEQRLQREKIVYCLGLAYFVLKAIFWLNRN